ncbi:MAG: hypothetical protein ABSF15_22985 [Candidatus Sulfotelmatobacter sp.]
MTTPADVPSRIRELATGLSQPKAMRRGSLCQRKVKCSKPGCPQEQIAAGRKFRSQVDDYWEACEQWADRQLEDSAAASQEAAKKGGAKRTSRPRLSKKSKRS